MMLDDAIRIVNRAIELAADRGVRVAVAVVDPGGHLIALHRMDGVPFIAAEIAWGKAWTAAAWRESSEAQATKAAALPLFATAISVATGGRYMPQAGGIPIRRGEIVLGAVGASGLAAGDVDQEMLLQAVSDTGLFNAG
jgi:glc operon protein GlcG